MTLSTEEIFELQAKAAYARRQQPDEIDIFQPSKRSSVESNGRRRSMESNGRRSSMESTASTQASSSQSEKSSHRGRYKQEGHSIQDMDNPSDPIDIKLNRTSLSPMPTRRAKSRSTGINSKTSYSSKSNEHEFVFEPTEEESVATRLCESKGNRHRRQPTAEFPGSARRKGSIGSVDVDRHQMFVRRISASGSIASRITVSTPTPGKLARSLSMRATNSLRAHPSMSSQRKLTRGMSSSKVDKDGTNSKATLATKVEQSLRPHPSMSEQRSISRARSSGRSIDANVEMHSSMPILETFNLPSSSPRTNTRRQSSTSQLSHQVRSHSQQRTMLTPQTSERQKLNLISSQRLLVSPCLTNNSRTNSYTPRRSSKSKLNKISPKRDAGPAQLVFTPAQLMLSPLSLNKRLQNDSDQGKQTTSTTSVTDKKNIQARKNLLRKTMARKTSAAAAATQTNSNHECSSISSTKDNTTTSTIRCTNNIILISNIIYATSV